MLPHDKTNKMACAPSEHSDQSSLCAQWVAKGPVFLHADIEDSDQTGWMLDIMYMYNVDNQGLFRRLTFVVY